MYSFVQTCVLVSACAISVLHLIFSCLQSNGKGQYRRVPTRSPQKKEESTNDGSNISLMSMHSPLADETTLEDDDDDVGRDEYSDQDRLSIKINKPKRALWFVIIEAGILIGTVGVDMAAIIVNARDHRVYADEAWSLAAWAYMLALVALRLLFIKTEKDILRVVWNHSAWLYGTRWALIAVQLMLTELGSPLSLSQILQVDQFCLVSILALIVVSTRNPRGVMIKHQAQLRPNQEAFASLLSKATFSWNDGMVWTGRKQGFGLADVWDLQQRDKANEILRVYRAIPRNGRLLWRLVRHFKENFAIQWFSSFVAALLIFIPTLLLQAILRILEDPEHASRSRAWFYVAMLAVSGCAYGIAEGRASWTGRKTGLHLEAIFVGEIYTKMLNRKATDSQDAGAITNMMSVDSSQVGDTCSYIHDIFPDAVVQLVLSAVLLFSVLGWSAVASFAMLAVMFPLNTYFARLFARAYKGVMDAMDERSEITNEVLQNAKLVKYFAWEQKFTQSIEDCRKGELRALRTRFFALTAAATTWHAIPLVITTVSFLFYTMVEKKSLVPSIAFPALTIIGLLRTPLDRIAVALAQFQQGRSALHRIEAFLDNNTQESMPNQTQNEDGFIGFRHATLSWEKNGLNSSNVKEIFQLVDIDVDFHRRTLNIITGPSAAGKSSLLMGLLGELTVLQGNVHFPSHAGIAYCAQESWLTNETVRDNIIFSSPWDENRYHAVIDACALSRDLEILAHGDKTLVGNKGIALSGGQRQRISLARAAYSRAETVLLDDCLSAVDSYTAQHVFRKLILGPLMKNRTVILATHNVALCAPHSEKIVILVKGQVVAQGSYGELSASGYFDNESQSGTSESEFGTATGAFATVRIGESANSIAISRSEASRRHPYGPERERSEQAAGQYDIDSKNQDRGQAISWRAMKLYAGFMGPWYYWIFILVGFTAEGVALLATNYWVRVWSGAYESAEDGALDHSHHRSLTTASQLNHRTLEAWDARPSSGFTSDPGVNNFYYTRLYGALALAYVLAFVSRYGLIFRGSLKASKAIHSRLLATVLGAKLNFFDTTPIGQVLNRFSKDLQTIDQLVALAIARWLESMTGVITIIVLISVITPMFLIVSALLTFSYAAAAVLYVKSARNLKAIEASQRGPLYHHFNETLNGLTTIRAYGQQRRFIKDNEKKIDMHNRPFFFLLAATRWLGLRINFASAFVSSFATAFVLLRMDSIDPAAAGLSLSYALGFNETILWVVRLFTENEQNMKHVERVEPLLELEQEAPAINPRFRAPSNWAGEGEIQFINYSTRYRSDLKPVLRNLTLKILAREKIGIIGRTGAGKSSFALALLRGLEAESGKVIIDGLDINQLGLRDLRRSIAFVPQDPSLFTGTIRTTLDPFGLSTDEEILTVLQRVHLIDSTMNEPSYSNEKSLRSPTAWQVPNRIDSDGLESSRGHAFEKEYKNINMFNLSAPVAPSGSNISHGQRQLLCLARVLLRDPRILIMDEATASIDLVTDAKIQSTIRELTQTTIITIAHRLQTIIDYDRILVLDDGRVVEFDAPWELLKKESGAFRGMCEKSGNLNGLVHAARQAEAQKKHVSP